MQIKTSPHSSDETVAGIDCRNHCSQPDDYRIESLWTAPSQAAAQCSYRSQAPLMCRISGKSIDSIGASRANSAVCILSSQVCDGSSQTILSSDQYSEYLQVPPELVLETGKQGIPVDTTIIVRGQMDEG